MAMRTHEAAEKWGITARRVRVLCVNGQIDGAWREGKIWYIPDNAPKPADGRIRSKETLIVQIERKKAELDTNIIKIIPTKYQPSASKSGTDSEDALFEYTTPQKERKNKRYIRNAKKVYTNGKNYAIL